MATVIKSSAALPGATGAAFNFDDMAIRADQYLAQVRVQAAQLVEQARQEAAAVRARAEEEGRAAALKAAEKVLDEKVGRQLTTLLPALAKAVEGVQQARHAWLSHWQQAALRVVTAVAAKVIRREVTQQPQITLDLVREALELAAGSADVELQLHPDDHAALGSQVQRLISELGRLGQARVTPQPDVEAGSCRVQTRFGSIDQQFAVQLERIAAELAT